MPKPLSGVIRNWSCVEGPDPRVHGICVIHSTYANGIVDDYPIITSRVVRFFTRDGIVFVETKNSIYILVP